MKVVLDCECDRLVKPEHIWVVVCKDILDDKLYIFRNITNDPKEKKRFKSFALGVEGYIGHHILGYDLPVLSDLIEGFTFDIDQCIDTYCLSKLLNYSREEGHSIEDYGEEFSFTKGVPLADGTTTLTYPKDFFKCYSLALEEYCIRDVDIAHRIYLKYLKDIHKPSLCLEQRFQLIVNDLHKNGFCFNKPKAELLLKHVTEELKALDKDILEQFPPKEELIREFIPRATKFGTISRTSVPRGLHSRIHDYEIGQTYKHTRWIAFNPSSHKQVVNALNEAGWKPTDKTKTHIETERQLNRLKFTPGKDLEKEKELRDKLSSLTVTGWKVNETNLTTLPVEAPQPARTLAKRILLESRRRTLTEWLGLVQDDGRVHGQFIALGAWTHRMAHQKPNTANIPNEFNVHDGSIKLLGKELRALWCAPKKRLLVGVDAEGIQLRVFAHYINDKDLTEAIVNGKKSDKTDPHSFNQTVFGPCCKTRQAAKHSLYAIFFGGGPSKIAEIMGCTREEAKEAIDRLIKRYPGLDQLQREQFTIDAKRGYFIGLDGRRVPIPGDTVGDRKHLCMSGYLQNGEAICMKKACLKWQDMLKQNDAILVNFVHDEWQVECPNRMSTATSLASTMADSLRIVGEELNLHCPLAGSFYNDDKKDYTIGTTWAVTH
jgi:DNA polymerase-1